MPDTKTESAADQVRLMRTDLTNGLDDLLASLQAVTRGGGRLAVSGGNVVEREINMAVTLSDEIRNSVFSAEALKDARAHPLNGRLRKDGYHLVDLLADVAGVTVHGAIRAADRFFAQRPRLADPAEPDHDKPDHDKAAKGSS
jgi:hypothetical protein